MLDLADRPASLVEVEVAEALLVPLAPGCIPDEPEGDQHEQVPLPPGGVPVPREGNREHRLGKQSEGGHDGGGEEAAPGAPDLRIAGRRVAVKEDADRRERDQGRASDLGRKLAVERRQ